MAQKIQTLLIDDLDGSSAEGMARFGLDGTEYEIDLNGGHAKELRDVLARYVGCCPPGRRQRPQASPGQPPRNDGWAEHPRGPPVGQAQGIEVKDRGRVPADLMVKFKAATSQQG